MIWRRIGGQWLVDDGCFIFSHHGHAAETSIYQLKSFSASGNLTRY